MKEQKEQEQKEGISRAERTIQVMVDSRRVSIENDECQVRLTGIEREYWMGTEIRLAD